MKKTLTTIIALAMLFATSCNQAPEETQTETEVQQQAADSTTTTDTTASHNHGELPEVVLTDADTRIVMTVGGRDITYAELYYYLKNFQEQFGEEAQPDDLTAQAEYEIKIATAIALHANELGIVELPDDYINANVTDPIYHTMEEYNKEGSGTSYAAELEKYHLTDKLFRDLQMNMAFQGYTYQEKYSEGKELCSVTDEAILEYVKNNYVRVKHILIKTTDLDETQKAEKRNLADSIIDMAKNGTPFEELVTEYSEDGMPVDTGYYFTYNKMVAEFEAASFELEVGEISDIVESVYGYHIIKKYEMEDEYILSDEEIRNEVVGNLSFNIYASEVLEKAAGLEVTYADDYSAAVDEILGANS